MKEPFTMADYIRANQLDVDIQDAGATRLIARRLRELGYVRVKRMGRPMWIRRPPRDLTILNDKLRKLK